MRLLSLSIDRHIADKDSNVRSRMEHYGTLVHGIDVIAFGVDAAMPIRCDNNVTIHGVGAGNRFLAFFRALGLARKIAQPDTVITVQDPFELGLWGVIAARLLSVPLHVQVHIDFFSPYFKKESIRQRIQAWIAPFVLRRADAVRAVSWKIARYASDAIGVEKDKIFVAPVFVDLDRIRNKPASVDLHAEFKEFEWILLVACRFVPQKNIPLAIDAFVDFHAANPACGMVIAGSGPGADALDRKIADMGAAAFVKRRDWADHFASCMKTCDAFLISSDYEGWAMTAVEAASCGKPVVMTDVGCAGEFIIDQKNGIVVPVRDRKAISSALNMLRSDPGFGQRLGSEAVRDAASYMTRAENDKLLLASWKRAMTHI